MSGVMLGIALGIFDSSVWGYAGVIALCFIATLIIIIGIDFVQRKIKGKS